MEIKKVAVVGAGWNGVHCALEFAKKGYRVVLCEKGKEIFSDVSGNFGIRLHAGPHYPRSEATRNSCHKGLALFREAYPDLVNENEYSIYAIGREDADGQPSKVTPEYFQANCTDYEYSGRVDCEAYGYDTKNVLGAFNFTEPCAVLGSRLRAKFKKELARAGVSVKYNFAVNRLEKIDNKMRVGAATGRVEEADYVVNTTSYKALLPQSYPLPFNMDIVYQPCLALVYKDKKPSDEPISFIVMDGWFPCLMPYDDRKTTDKPIAKYIMTHGKWTLMASYKTAAEANEHLGKIDDDFVKTKIMGACEQNMAQFWPKFSDRFEYQTWVGAVLAKINTKAEFRSSVVFQDERGVIHVFPGKVTNVFEAYSEVEKLVDGQEVVKESGYRYVKDGVLDAAKEEIRVKGDKNSTCALQTFRNWEKFPEGCESGYGRGQRRRRDSERQEEGKEVKRITTSPQKKRKPPEELNDGYGRGRRRRQDSERQEECKEVECITTSPLLQGKGGCGLFDRAITARGRSSGSYSARAVKTCEGGGR